MVPDFARGEVGWEALFAVITFAGSLVVALIVHPFISRLARALAGKTQTTLDDLLIQAIQRPLFLLILVVGIFLSLTNVSYLDRWQGNIDKAWIVAVSVMIVIIVQRVVNAFITWYGKEVATKTQGQLDDKLLPLIKRFLMFGIYSVAFLLILDNLGVKLGPLIAGLGLGGLAVALALQPTLSNLFSSAMMVSDGTVSVGDFIELQGGPMGNIIDVGWRSTKIMTPQGNVVSIPNAKLADTIFTNYQLPNPEMNEVITCGVSYDSDLALVEKAALEVCVQVRDSLPDTVSVKSFEPVLRFREFADSNITFIVVVRAADRGSTFLLTHEVVKQLHERFGKEGIEINYPVRKLVFPEDGSPPKAGPAALRGGKAATRPRAKTGIDDDAKGDHGPGTP